MEKPKSAKRRSTYAMNMHTLGSMVVSLCSLGVSPCLSLAQEAALPCANVNRDGVVDLADAVYLLNFLFLGGPGLDCPDATTSCGDVNGDERVEITDAVVILDWLFLGGAVPECAGSETVIMGFTFIGDNGQGFPEYEHEQTGMEFVLLPGGDFRMGSPPDECGRYRNSANRERLHTVTLSPFLISKYEVSQAEYAAVMTGHASLSSTPSFHTGDRLPVEQVSWDDIEDADGFLARTGLELPSEAQWEYACRAGTTTPFAYGATLDSVDEANILGLDSRNTDCSDATGNTSRGGPIDVGSLRPNAFGLFDMHGNVWEWCEDVSNDDFYASPAAAGPDPVNDTVGFGRIQRGGSFDSFARDCRSAQRVGVNADGRVPNRGFRPVRRLQ